MLNQKEQQKPQERSNEMKILIYQHTIYKIGGIETFLYNFVKYYQDKDITIVYKEADMKQLFRLSEYCNVLKDEGQNFECEICILSNYNANINLDRITAKRIIQMIHADFSVMDTVYKIKCKHDKRVDKIITVSKTAHDGLKKMYGLESEVIYNIPDYDFKDEKVLKLVTLTRGTREKGIFRIIKMANEFKKHNKKFIWYLATTFEQIDGKAIKELNTIKEIKIVESDLGNRYLINECDYLVQLSDTESYCYSVAEALQRRTPVITTNYPATYEMVTDGVNGYILDMNLSNLDVDKIFNEIPEVGEYVDLCDTKKWDRLLK